MREGVAEHSHGDMHKLQLSFVQQLPHQESTQPTSDELMHFTAISTTKKQSGQKMHKE